MSKRISVQWRITILTALLIAAACVSLNLLLFYSGSNSMDKLNDFVVEYKTGNQQEMTPSLRISSADGRSSRWAILRGRPGRSTRKA